MSKATLYRQAEIVANELGSLYRDTRRCRDDLLDFMDANEWFGQEVKGTGDDIYLPDMSAVIPGLTLWMKGYGRNDEEKILLLLEQFEPLYPKTCERLRDFIGKSSYCAACSLRVMDFIFSSIEGEITDYEDSKIQCLLNKSGEYLGSEGTGELISFVNELKKNDIHLVWDYKRACHSEHLIANDNEAFELDRYSRMAYLVFSPESWEINKLVDKAVASGRCAKLWLFIALHFVSALRKTDIEQLPVPVLEKPGEMIRERIKEGLFTDSEACEVSETWIFLIETLALKPQKTRKYKAIPTLKVFIPESLKTEFGIMLTLAASRHVQGTPFISAYAENSLLELFFGTDFVKASGDRYFRTRKANKSFLQGIEAVADNKPGKPKGYMLAALARSHKGGIGTLSKITDIYLKDESFTGYKPEFILREMFERGIFGFIPAILLDHYAGEKYRNLDVSAQTSLICGIGMTPLQIEEVADCVRRSMIRAEEIVKYLLSGVSRERLHQALQSIATDSSHAKDEGFCCIKIALGQLCDKYDRKSCIGCGYEVYTKTAFHLLMREYKDILTQKHNTEGFEQERLSNILKKGIIPALAEIVTSIPILYPGSDMELFETILERGLRNAANSED